MFENRADAGRRLLAGLKKIKLTDAVIMCIPRGGVVVGAELARDLDAPMDLVAPRKIGAPANPEMAVGAVAQDGSTYLNERLVDMLGIARGDLDGLIEKEVKEIERRMTGYRGSTEYPDYKKNTIILVDDGAATGYTMLAAAEFARKELKPARLVIAVPVAPPDTLELFAQVADEVVCLLSAADFYAVGQFYRDFSQTTDREVLSILDKYMKKQQIS